MFGVFPRKHIPVVPGLFQLGNLFFFAIFLTSSFVRLPTGKMVFARVSWFKSQRKYDWSFDLSLA